MLPKMMLVRWWMSVGTKSRMLFSPSVALPPAASTTKPRGRHSYSSLRLPLGLEVSAGYMNAPPERRVRWTSPTIDPMYLREYELPAVGCFLSLIHSLVHLYH